MIEQYYLYCCPFCRKAPLLHMDYDEETWRPIIKCSNMSCNVNPKTKTKAIRKKQKTDREIIKTKIEKVISYWNDPLTLCRIRMDFFIRLDFDLISKQQQLKEKL